MKMPVPPRQALGKLGEQIAVDFVRNQLGWRIVATNWKYKNYEIDIIAEDPKTSTIIFVEVKTTSGRYLPEQQINSRKENALIEAAHFWLNSEGKEYKNRELRFDVIAVHLFRPDKYRIMHCKDAFYPIQ